MQFILDYETTVQRSVTGCTGGHIWRHLEHIVCELLVNLAAYLGSWRPYTKQYTDTFGGDKAGSDWIISPT